MCARKLIHLSWALFLLLAGCSSERQPARIGESLSLPLPATRMELSGASLPRLPEPAALLPPEQGPSASRQVRYLNADLLKLGADFDSGLPSARVTVQLDGALYDPDWDDNSDGFGSLAFAIYNFSLPDYDGSPELSYVWEGTAPPTKDTFVLLANFADNRWDIFQGTAAGQVEFSSLQPYFNPAGDLLACLLLSGTGVSTLASLRIGGIVPTASLSGTPLSGNAPLGVDFDASASTDSDGSIAEYRWDPEGDGSFDLSTGADPLLHFDYPGPGDFTAAVEVRDNDGMREFATLPVAVLDGINFTLGSAADEEARAVFDAGGGQIAVVAERDPTSSSGTNQDVLLLQVSPLQNLSFAKAFDLGGSESVQDAARAADGSIYVCGILKAPESTKREGMLQKWSAEGELLWSKRLNGPGDHLELNGIVFSGNAVYVCGQMFISDYLGLVMRFDPDGNQQWAFDFTAPTSMFLNDIHYRDSVIIGFPGEVRVCGDYGAGGQTDALFLLLEDDGTLTFSRRLGEDNFHKSGRVLAVGGTPFIPTVFVAIQDGMSRMLFSQVGGATIRLNTPPQTLYTPHALRRSGSGFGLLCTAFGAGPFGFMLDLSPDPQLASAVSFGSPVGDCAMLAQTGFTDGTLLAGSTAGGETAVAAHTFNSEASSLTWQDAIVPQVGTTVTVTDTSLTTTDVTDLEFNRESAGTETDICLLLVE